MVFLLVIFIVLIGSIILLFSSKTLSPIPYFPSQKIDLPLIIEALKLKNNHTVFDLGAGDGIIIFKAAKKAFQKNLNTKFIAVEINPILILILHLRRLFHQNKKNIQVIYGNMFFMNFNKLITHQQSTITFYLYISPWFLEKTLKNIKSQIKKFNLVSYMYEVKSLRKKQKILYGKNKVFIYQNLFFF